MHSINNKKIIMVVFSIATEDRRVIREVNALSEVGFDVEVFFPYFKKMRRKIPEKGRFVEVKSGVFVSTPLRFAAFWLKVLGNVYSIRPWAIHCHDVNTLPVGFLLARLRKCLLVYDSHEYAAGVKELKNNTLKRIFWSNVESFFASRADVIIAVNRHISRMLRRFRKLKLDPIVLMNASELHRSGFSIARKRTSPKIVYHSALVQGRGVDQVIKAFGKIEQASLFIYGKGKERKRFEALAKNFGANVVFGGWVEPENLACSLEDADVGLSLISGDCLNNRLSSANKVFDYACLKIPQVGSNHPVMRELIANEGIGVCVDETDEESIAKGIKKVLSDDDFRRELLRNLDEKNENYSWDKEKLKLQKLYKRLSQRI
ncbi:glycosyltransferase family 4 protein [candidate division WOR-3 bacterium]|nr:glycosyltransferase family 4 protein [candidate division WOR-3 bacterium]